MQRRKYTKTSAKTPSNRSCVELRLEHIFTIIRMSSGNSSWLTSTKSSKQSNVMFALKKYLSNTEDQATQYAKQNKSILKYIFRRQKRNKNFLIFLVNF